jgi:hypothetical protein
MPVVPRVLLDHVDQDPSQAGCPTVGPGAPGQPLKAAVGQRLRDQGAGAGRFQVKSMVSFSWHAKARSSLPTLTIAPNCFLTNGAGSTPMLLLSIFTV